jgi:hypothetical protein
MSIESGATLGLAASLRPGFYAGMAFLPIRTIFNQDNMFSANIVGVNNVGLQNLRSQVEGNE